MNEKLLLALDLDGTLLNSALEISPSTRQSLLEFRNRGHVVTLATGRPLQGARQYAEELGLTAPLILNNGALVAETDGTVHKFYPVDVETGRELLRFCQAHSLSCSFFVGQEIYMLRPCALSDRLHRRHDLTVPRVAQNPLAIIARGVTSYAVIVEPEKAGAVCAGLQSHFGGRLHIARAGSHFIDIFQPGVSKGRALRDLAQELGIAAANVIAVGDNHNDLEMLEFAGLGVAMAGADAVVRSVADYVTAGNDDDGIALLVDKLLRSGNPLSLKKL